MKEQIALLQISKSASSFLRKSNFYFFATFTLLKQMITWTNR